VHEVANLSHEITFQIVVNSEVIMITNTRITYYCYFYTYTNGYYQC